MFIANVSYVHCQYFNEHLVCEPTYKKLLQNIQNIGDAHWTYSPMEGTVNIANDIYNDVFGENTLFDLFWICWLLMCLQVTLVNY